jgi:hypothetical protein
MLVSESSSVDHPKIAPIFSVSAPHLKRLNGHSPLRACDHIISAVGPSNHPRFAVSYIPVPFSLLLLNITLNALEIIFHPTNANQPIIATFPTPHQNCFWFGFMFV